MVGCRGRKDRGAYLTAEAMVFRICMSTFTIADALP
jgi:hypothetical protein